MILHGYNDHYGGCPGTEHPGDAPINERTYFEQNARRLIELMPDNEVFCAELYRELGEFEQALAILNNITADGYMAQIVEQLKERALMNDSSVFVLNEKDARDNTRNAIEDEPGFVYDAEADKTDRKKDHFFLSLTLKMRKKFNMYNIGCRAGKGTSRFLRSHSCPK